MANKLRPVPTHGVFGALCYFQVCVFLFVTASPSTSAVVRCSCIRYMGEMIEVNQLHRAAFYVRLRLGARFAGGGGWVGKSAAT